MWDNTDQNNSEYGHFSRSENLSYVVKKILTLSHGQASVDRGFSINKSLVKVNMKEETIVAK